MSKLLSTIFSRIFKEKITVVDENKTYNSQPLLTLNKHSMDYYRRFVKGNGDISEGQARRKMTRNMNLAHIYKQDSPEKYHPRTWYMYGCLRFIVRNNEVVWMENFMPIPKSWGWEKDWNMYEKLNKELGIKDKWNK